MLTAGVAALVLPARARQAGGGDAIQIVVPYGPGGLGDVIARAVAPHMQEKLGRSIMVVNRPGANAMIGADAVAKARPDGHTLLMGYTSEIAINPGFYPTATYTSDDLTPIGLAGVSPLLLIGRKALPYATLRELAADARNRPGGAGSPAHIAGEALRRRLGAEMTHVPYRGGAAATMDVLAGNVDIFFAGVAPAPPHVRDGLVHGYAVTGDRRSPVLPEVPTMAEAGFDGFDLSGWLGLLAPANTPDAVVAPLAEALQQALRLPAVRDVLVPQGVDVSASTPEEFRRFIAAETPKYAELVRTLGITSDQ